MYLRDTWPFPQLLNSLCNTLVSLFGIPTRMGFHDIIIHNQGLYDSIRDQVNFSPPQLVNGPHIEISEPLQSKPLLLI